MAGQMLIMMLSGSKGLGTKRTHKRIVRKMSFKMSVEVGQSRKILGTNIAFHFLKIEQRDFKLSRRVQSKAKNAQ